MILHILRDRMRARIPAHPHRRKLASWKCSNTAVAGRRWDGWKPRSWLKQAWASGPTTLASRVSTWQRTLHASTLMPYASIGRASTRRVSCRVHTHAHTRADVHTHVHTCVRTQCRTHTVDKTWGQVADEIKVDIAIYCHEEWGWGLLETNKK